MASICMRIEEVTPANTPQILFARLAQCYHVPIPGNAHLIRSVECIFEDHEGAKIPASISGCSLQHMYLHLTVGHLYGLKNFVVGEDNRQFHITDNPYHITFTTNTMLVEICPTTYTPQSLQVDVFKRRAFISNVDSLRTWLRCTCTECLQGLRRHGNFVVCTKCGSRENDGQLRPKVEVILQDESGNQRQTFWDKDCAQLLGV